MAGLLTEPPRHSCAGLSDSIASECRLWSHDHLRRHRLILAFRLGTATPVKVVGRPQTGHGVVAFADHA